MTGAWTLTDDGEFVLDEAFEEKLNSIKAKLRERWLETICEELSESTNYNKDELLDNFLTRVEKSTDVSGNIVDEFIIEALEGSL